MTVEERRELLALALMGSRNFSKARGEMHSQKKSAFHSRTTKNGQSVSPPSLYISAVSDAALKSCLRKKMMEHEWEVINWAVQNILLAENIFVMVYARG